MSGIRLRALAGPADALRLRLTVAEASSLRLTFHDTTVTVCGAEWSRPARWDAESLVLTVPDPPLAAGRPVELSVDDDQLVLIVAPDEVDAGPAGEVPRVAVLDDLVDLRITSEQRLDLAARLVAHRASPGSRQRRHDAPTVVGTVAGQLGATLERMPAVPHRLLVGSPRSRMLTAIHWCLDVLAAGRYDHARLAVPAELTPPWTAALDAAAHFIGAGLHRSNLSFVAYDDLPDLRHDAARSLLVIDAAEHALGRWPQELPAMLRGVSGSLVLGDGADGIPGWAQHLLTELGESTALSAAPPARSLALQRRPYTPTESELHWRQQQAGSRRAGGSPDPMSVLGAMWMPGASSSTDAVELRLGTAVAECRRAEQDGRQVVLTLSSLAALDRARELLAAAPGSSGVPVRTSVTLHLAGDVLPDAPDRWIVYGDPGALLQRPSGLGAGAVVCAASTSDEVLLDAIDLLSDVAARWNLDPDRLADRLRWPVLAGRLLREGAAPNDLRHALTALAQQQTQRLARLATQTPLPTSVNADDHGAPLTATAATTGLITAALRELGTDLGFLRDGASTLRVVGACGPHAPFPVGTVLALDQRSVAETPQAIDLCEGSTNLERLHAAVLATRISLEVAAVAPIEDVPIGSHAPRLQLIHRRYCPPATAEVRGDFLRFDDKTPKLESLEFGELVRHGRPRRAAPTGSEDPGIPAPEVLAALVDELEAATSPDRALVTARFCGGDDVMLEERWRRDDGIEIVLRSPAPRDGAPAWRDARGEPIRHLDVCDAGHAVDAGVMHRCEVCTAERCPDCPGHGQGSVCLLCGAAGCSQCVTAGLCRDCRRPSRAPEHDQQGLRGWRVRGAWLQVGPGQVTVHRDEGADLVHYVPDVQCGTELDARRRALLHRYELQVDAPVVLLEPPDLDEPTGLLADDQAGREWVVVDTPPAGSRPVTDVTLLAEGPGPAVRPLSVIGLDRTWIRRRHREAPVSHPKVLLHRSYVDRSELAVADDGMWWRTTRYYGDGSTTLREQAAVVFEAPLVPRNDTDGRLLAVARVGDASMELLAVNASVLLRIQHYGVTREYFAGVSEAVSHGSEAAWHAVGRSYGLPEHALIVAPHRRLDRAGPRGFAEPELARLRERTVAPHAAFVAAGRTSRPVDAGDLAALRRAEIDTTATVLGKREARALRTLALAQRPQSSQPVTVQVAFTISEEWEAAGSRALSYRVADGADAFPPLDDGEIPGHDFTVDSAGHLHRPHNGYDCDACVRAFCSVCPPDTRLAPCGTCAQLACGPCRARPPVPIADASCPRCERRSCGDCGTDVDLRRCACCTRELCRWCVPSELPICPTCTSATASFDAPLPGHIPVTGCTLSSESDRDATVVVLQGAQRREVVVLREAGEESWIAFHDDLREVVATVAAARRWGREYRLKDLQEQHGPRHAEPAAAVWSTVTSVLEIGPRSSLLSADLHDRELLDVIAETVDDDGPYPRLAAAGQRLPDGLPQPRTGRALPLVRHDLRTSVEVTVDGLTMRTDRAASRRRGQLTLASWRYETIQPDGRQRWHAEVGPVTCELLAAGRDVELRVTVDDQERSILLAGDQADIAAAALVAHAGRSTRAPAAVVELLLPDEAVPILVEGRELLERRWRPVTRPLAEGAPLTVDRLTAACEQLGLPIPQRSGVIPQVPFSEVVAGFVAEPNDRVVVGVEAQERYQGEVLVEYQVWPSGRSWQYERDGRTVQRLSIDDADHVVTQSHVCRYCGRRTCMSCERPVHPCSVCSILICGRCRSPEPIVLCPACRQLSRAPFWASRKLYSRPRPWRFLHGTDSRHRVVVGQRSGIVRMVSLGDFVRPETPLLPGGGLSHVARGFQR